MKTPSEANFLFKRVLAQMPYEVIDTFTEEQLAALQLACQQLKSKKHTVEIRLSMPLFKGGFYLTLLAGQERRSDQRLHEGAIRSQIAVVSIVLALVLGGAATTIGLAQFFRSFVPALRQAEYHPTAIPWLDSEAECQKTGRYWREGHCWDREHDANF